MNLTAGQLDQRGAVIWAGRDATLTLSGTWDARDGAVLQAGRNLRVQAAAATVGGAAAGASAGDSRSILQANTGTLTAQVSGHLTDQGSRWWAGGNLLQVDAGQVNLTGSTLGMSEANAQARLVVRGDTIRLNGSQLTAPQLEVATHAAPGATAGADIQVQASNLLGTRSLTVTSGHDVTTTGSRLQAGDDSGRVGQLSLQAGRRVATDGASQLLSSGGLTLTAPSLDLGGRTYAARQLLLNTDQLRHTGDLQSDGALEVQALPGGSLAAINSGTLRALGDASIRFETWNNQGGLVHAEGQLTVVSGRRARFAAEAEAMAIAAWLAR